MASRKRMKTKAEVKKAARRFLKQKVVPVDPLGARSAAELLAGLGRCSFQGRQLAHALDVCERMCRDRKCLRVLSLAGALVPAGMGLVVIRLIEAGLVDVIVCTGATIAHDMCNATARGGQAAPNAQGTPPLPIG